MRDFQAYQERAMEIARARRRIRKEFTEHAYVRKFRPDELEHDPQILPWFVTATRNSNRGFRFGTQAKAMRYAYEVVSSARQAASTG